MATSSRRRCLNEPNVFCYICGEYTLQHNRKTISDFLKRAYLAYFKVMLVDQEKPWAPTLCANLVAINFTGDKGFQILLLLSDHMLFKIELSLSVGVGVQRVGPVV